MYVFVLIDCVLLQYMQAVHDFQCLRAAWFAVIAEFGLVLSSIWECNMRKPSSQIVMRSLYKSSIVKKREFLRALCGFMPK